MWGFAPAWRATAASALGDRSDEWALWRRFRAARDPGTRHHLVMHHAPLARILAARAYASRADAGLDFADYKHFGMVALIDCVDRFEPERGIRFESYATARIRGAIADGAAALSERQRQAAARQQRVRERTALLAQAQCAEPPQRPIDQVADLAIGLAFGFMLDDSAQCHDPHDEPRAADPTYRHADLRATQALVNNTLCQLAAPEQRVLSLHYLHGVQFCEIAADMGLSRARISQLHRAGLTQLRQCLAQRGLQASDCF